MQSIIKPTIALHNQPARLLNLTESVPLLQLNSVSKGFTRTAPPAVNQVSLQLAEGEILALLGPSGCGKTTLLRLVAGFEQPQAGEILLLGRSISTLSPEKRNVGMVFQDFALFPHLNVWQNVAFGLRRHSADKAKKIVSQALSLVELSDLGDRYPHQLSGGQQQRVALARAIAPNPALILLDEPLSNLDAQIRMQLRRELRQILKTTGKTAIFVTHDQEEALHLADQVAVMRSGKIEQIGTPQKIYQQPASRFVAEFVSQANMVSAVRKGNYWHTEIGDFAINKFAIDDLPFSNLVSNSKPHSGSTALNSINLNSAVLMIRQECLGLELDPNGIAIVSDRLFVGRDLIYYLKTQSGKELVARTDTSVVIAIGDSVNLKVSETEILTFGAE